ncbi:MAG: hypothetical protein J6Y90_01310 [Lachnospiraceae bacterium]|nr:hypothetical protein [Lachnospiraceae bacterium]
MAKNLLVEEFPMAEKALNYSGGPWILDTDICNYAGACRFYVGLMHEIEVLEGEDFLGYAKHYLSEYIVEHLTGVITAARQIVIYI